MRKWKSHCTSPLRPQIFSSGFTYLINSSGIQEFHAGKKRLLIKSRQLIKLIPGMFGLNLIFKIKTCLKRKFSTTECSREKKTQNRSQLRAGANSWSQQSYSVQHLMHKYCVSFSSAGSEHAATKQQHCSFQQVFSCRRQIGENPEKILLTDKRFPLTQYSGRET